MAVPNVFDLGVATIDHTKVNANFAYQDAAIAGIVVGAVPTATAGALGIVRPDNTTITVSGGVLTAVAVNSVSTAFVRTAYTTSGAISTANTLAILNGSTALAMTLVNGTVDGQPILIKQLGAASATVAATIDGISQTVTLAVGTPGTITDALKLRWSVADTSWLAE